MDPCIGAHMRNLVVARTEGAPSAGGHWRHGHRWRVVQVARNHAKGQAAHARCRARSEAGATREVALLSCAMAARRDAQRASTRAPRLRGAQPSLTSAARHYFLDVPSVHGPPTPVNKCPPLVDNPVDQRSQERALYLAWQDWRRAVSRAAQIKRAACELLDARVAAALRTTLRSWHVACAELRRLRSMDACLRQRLQAVVLQTWAQRCLEQVRCSCVIIRAVRCSAGSN